MATFIFSTNITGVWLNETAVAFESTPGWANVTMVLPGAVGQVVGYRWFANDTDGAWSSTGIQTLAVTAPVNVVNITLSTTGVTLKYTFDVEMTWTAPEEIEVNGVTTEFLRWNDGSTNPLRMFNTSGNYTVIYG